MEINISRRMALVHFFYSLTMSFILEVNIVAFFLFCEYLANYEFEQTLLLLLDRKSHISHRMWHCECCTSWPWPIFLRSRILKWEYLNKWTDFANCYRHSKIPMQFQSGVWETIRVYRLTQNCVCLSTFSNTCIISFLAMFATNSKLLLRILINIVQPIFIKFSQKIIALLLTIYVVHHMSL